MQTVHVSGTPLTTPGDIHRENLLVLNRDDHSDFL